MDVGLEGLVVVYCYFFGGCEGCWEGNVVFLGWLDDEAHRVRLEWLTGNSSVGFESSARVASYSQVAPFRPPRAAAPNLPPRDIVVSL